VVFPSLYTVIGGLPRVCTCRSATELKLETKTSGENLRNCHLKMEKKLLSEPDCYRILAYPAAALGTG
jgi:hypothetical protein